LEAQDFPFPAFALLLQPSVRTINILYQAVERLFSAAEQIMSARCQLSVKHLYQSVFLHNRMKDSAKNSLQCNDLDDLLVNSKRNTTIK